MRPAPDTGPLGKAIALILGAILLVLGFVFSLVLIAIIAVAGLAAFGYFWWKTRELRKVMREQPPGGRVIDGEVVVVEEYVETGQEVLPRDPPMK